MRRKEKEREQAFRMLKENQQSEATLNNGKLLKKKKLPAKKTVVDEAGAEWEVIDKKKTVIVEQSDSDSEDSEE